MKQCFTSIFLQFQVLDLVRNLKLIQIFKYKTIPRYCWWLKKWFWMWIIILWIVFACWCCKKWVVMTTCIKLYSSCCKQNMYMCISSERVLRLYLFLLLNTVKDTRHSSLSHRYYRFILTSLAKLRVYLTQWKYVSLYTFLKICFLPFVY